jgi:hypothetical protein
LALADVRKPLEKRGRFVAVVVCRNLKSNGCRARSARPTSSNGSRLYMPEATRNPPRRADCQSATRQQLWLLAVVSAALAASAAGHAATFGPIGGALNVRAGSKSPMSTPAIIGPVALSDFELPSAFVSASLQTKITGGHLFDFAATASSSTNAPDPLGFPRATASAAFQEPVTTTGLQWIQLTASVLKVVGDVETSAAVGFGRTGQPVTFLIGPSGGVEMTRAGLFAPGNYTVSAFSNTQASVPPAHAASLSGYLLIASFADFNGSTVVDGADLATWRTGFGSTSGAFASGNLDVDGDTDGADFLLWQRQLGTHALSTAAGQAVPEPSSAALLALALTVIQSSFACRTWRSAAFRATMSPAR